MRTTGCRREAPSHGYTTFGVEGRYIAARLYPRAMGLVRGGEREGVEILKKWRRQQVVPTVPEELPPWRTRFSGTYVSWPLSWNFRPTPCAAP